MSQEKYRKATEVIILKHIYNFATKAELDLLHQASMRTLDEVGVMFFCQDDVDIFKLDGRRRDV